MNADDQETVPTPTISASASPPQPIDKEAEFTAWTQIAQALRALTPEAQTRVLRSVVTLLEIDMKFEQRAENNSPPPAGREVPQGGYSENRQMSPKEFLMEKRPMTDVDRIACLAYYLTHYQSTPHFKTLDLSKLNTDAAQIKLSNAAQAVDNATKAGLLTSASKGNKQLSAVGEIYVQALPDKAAARAAVESYKTPRRARRTSTGRAQNEDSAS